MTPFDVHLDPDIIAAFLDEAPRYVSVLDKGLLTLEEMVAQRVVVTQDPEALGQLNEMFRAAHSLKGLAASLGLDRIRDLTHRMETLFDRIRSGKRELDPDTIQTLFGVFDTLNRLVDELTHPAEAPAPVEEALLALDRILKAEPVVPDVPDRQATSTVVPNGADQPAEAAAGAGPDQPARGEGVSGAERLDGASGSATGSSHDAGSTCAQPEAESADSLCSGLDAETTALFVVTTNETLDEFANVLLALEKSPHDPELVNSAFRCAHNIKGAVGAVGLRSLYRLTHNAETVLDLARSGTLEVTEDVISTILEAVDALRLGVAYMREGRAAEVERETKVGLFDRWITQVPAGGAPPDTRIDEPAASSTVDALAPDTLFESTEGDAWTVTVSFPQPSQDAPIHAYLILNRLRELAEVVRTLPDVEALDAASVVDRIRYVIHPNVTPEEIREAVSKYTTGQVVVSAPPSEAHHAPPPAVSNPPAPGPVRERSAPNAATATAGTVPTESPAAAPPPAAGASAPPGTPPQHRPAKDASASRAAEAPVVAKPTETLRVDLERLDQLMNLGGELVINKARLFQIRGRLDTVFDQGNVGWLIDDVSRRIERLQADVEALSRSGRQDHALSGLSSGLGLLARDFTSVRTLADRVRACRPVMNDFSEALHSLGRVSDGIQRRIMETRMVAIGPLFQRFRRVVRDISKSTGKNIELVLHGEGTELDKRMIDELGDPLTHMIRNSVDHGIEPPEERLRQGKPAVAHVTLDAYHRGRHICIEVRDDGRGVNIEAVRRKILEKQLASPADVERTSDKDVVQYIFRPGFSTAEKVTDLSGRGMGMDIVISKLDALNGTVEVDSVTGVGTTVTIRLPLTLAIIQAILARVGEGVYAIPLESVAEIISVQPDAVQNITRRYVTRVRDRIIRIVFFEDVFSTDLPGMGARSSRERALTLVILSMQNDQVGLVVDGLIGQEEVVIKSISDNFRNVPGISGASIMGDGSVSLILDVASMFGMLAERGARRQDGSGVDGIGRPGSAGGVEVEVALAG